MSQFLHTFTSLWSRPKFSFPKRATNVKYNVVIHDIVYILAFQTINVVMNFNVISFCDQDIQVFEFLSFCFHTKKMNDRQQSFDLNISIDA